MFTQHISDFATKKEKPSTEDYLRVHFNQLLDRLNENPNSLASEPSFIDAVIAVRHARTIERLNVVLLLLTGVASVATVALVFIPFFVPSLETQSLYSKIGRLQNEVSAIKSESESLREAVQLEIAKSK